MWTHRWVPLVLMACHPHCQTQPYWELRFLCGLHFSKDVQGLLPCVSRCTGVHSNEWALVPTQNTARTAVYM
ncbi:unnamed protein product [Staurois parvus]|uniref:Secreted protein n=1 Tax=Staurois parvus TaxID=386267 RepID=A0ABN9BJK3_9NEOB|nr:unnamed protein product [Staurois parvus]